MNSSVSLYRAILLLNPNRPPSSFILGRLPKGDDLLLHDIGDGSSTPTQPAGKGRRRESQQVYHCETLAEKGC